MYTDSSHDRITCLYDLVHYHIKFYAQLLHHNPKYLFKLTSVKGHQQDRPMHVLLNREIPTDPRLDLSIALSHFECQRHAWTKRKSWRAEERPTLDFLIVTNFFKKRFLLESILILDHPFIFYHLSGSRYSLSSHAQTPLNQSPPPASSEGNPRRSQGSCFIPRALNTAFLSML